MAQNDSGLTAEAVNLMRDGEWHDATRLIHRLAEFVPPGRAARHRKARGDTQRERALSGSIEVARIVVSAMLPRGYLEVEGRKPYMVSTPGAVRVRLKDEYVEGAMSYQAMAEWLDVNFATLHRILVTEQWREYDPKLRVRPNGGEGLGYLVYADETRRWAAVLAIVMRKRGRGERYRHDYILRWVPLDRHNDGLWCLSRKAWELVEGRIVTRPVDRPRGRPWHVPGTRLDSGAPDPEEAPS